jgi:hypothetical protein
MSGSPGPQHRTFGRQTVGQISENVRAMERWMRVLITTRPEPVAVVATAVSAVLIVGAFGASLSSAKARGASIAAAGAFLLLVVVGVSLYAWRLGDPGRSD